MGMTLAIEKKPQQKKIHIFFAEDNATDAFVFEKLFKKISGPREYSLVVKNAYEDALADIRQHKYDVYFIDYMLDKHTGIDLVNQAMSEGCHGPFIILTHHDKADYYHESAAMGVYDYLVKSELTPSMLDRAVVHALARQDIEARLQYEKTCMQYVIQTLPYAVLYIDRNFGIREINERVEEILGWPRKSIIGERVFDHIEAEEKDEIIDAFFKKRGTLISFKSLWKTEDGQEKTIFWDCIFRKYADRNSYLFIGRDMTEELALAQDILSSELEEVCESLDQAASQYGI